VNVRTIPSWVCELSLAVSESRLFGFFVFDSLSAAAAACWLLFLFQSYISLFFSFFALVVCRSEQPGLVTHISITDRAGTLVDRKVGRTYLPIIVVQVHSVFRFFLWTLFSSSSFAFHFFYLSRNSLSLLGPSILIFCFIR
jgi:hypothetical protein